VPVQAFNGCAAHSPLLRRRFRRGHALIIGLISIIILFTFSSLAVDFGRVMTSRSELMSGAEAAARAAAAALATGHSQARSAAVSVAQMNHCDGRPIVLDPNEDVIVGIWDETTRTFAANGGSSSSPANAVRVIARRSVERNNAIPLLFGKVFGRESCNVSGTATVMALPEPSDVKFAGVDSLDFSSLGVLARINGDIASNGNIRVGTPLGLLVGINGSARSYAGTVSKGGLAYITGSRSPLPEKLRFPSVQIPIHNDNEEIANYLNSSGDFSAVFTAVIPEGTYVVRDLNFLVGLNVRLEGPVTFYVKRNFNMAVGANLLGNPVYPPSHLKIRVIEGGTVNFLANLLTPVYMDMYAPKTNVNIAVGINHYHGRLIAKKLTIALPVLGRFTIDNSLGSPLEGQSCIVLVE